LKTLELGLSVPEELLSSIEVEQLKLERKLAGQRVDFLGEKIDFEQKLVAAKLELLDVKRAYEEGKIAYNEAAKAKFDVKAPVSGLVIYIPKQNGDRWEIGEGVWMLAKILKVADVSTLRVEAAVLEVDASRIAPGQAAEISIDAVPGLVIASTIDEIGRIVHERSAQDRSKVFDAFLPLGDVDTDVLRPGMGVRVRIETDQLNDRLTIPLEAVRRSSEGTYVELIRGGATARRPVTLGRSSAGRVIVESGLEEGDRVQLPGTSS
jgi:RND family efflux transporter MFP subunit